MVPQLKLIQINPGVSNLTNVGTAGGTGGGTNVRANGGGGGGAVVLELLHLGITINGGAGGEWKK